MPPRRHTLTLAILAAMVSTASLADTTDPKALLIEQGYYWQGKENADRAVETWQKLLVMSPEQPDALYGLGLAAVRANHLGEAQKYLVRLQALQPTPRLALQLKQDMTLSTDAAQKKLEEARVLGDSDQREKSVVLYRELFEGREPQGLIAREFYNTLGFLPEGWPEARVGLERLVRERPNDSIVALFLAKHLVRNPDSRAEGIRMLAKLTQRQDIAGDADESWRLGLVWMGPPNPSQVPLFEDFLVAHPTDDEIRALMNKGKSGGGSTWVRDPHVARGLKALDEGDLTTAENELQARLKVQPHDPDALGGMGVLRQKQHRLTDANNLLTQAVREPGGASWQNALDDVHYWILLGQANDAQRVGQFDQSRDLIGQAMRLNSRQVAGPLALAGVQTQSGQLEIAEASYRQILEKNPNNPDALAGLINVLARENKPDQALQVLDSVPPELQAKLGDPSKLRAMRFTQAGKLAERRGDIDGARKAFQQAQHEQPDDAWARFDLARLYLHTGHPQEARDLVDGLLKTRPTDPDALYTSTLLHAELGEWSQAQSTLARIPADKRTHDMNELAIDINLNVQIDQAVTLAKRGQKQEALGLLSRCESVAGQKPERVATLASAYVDAGDPDHGLALMSGLMNQYPAPSPELRLLQAGVLLKADQDGDAADILRDLQSEPLNATARTRYDNLLYLYRIKQADRLRESGDLVAAYDMLSPALAQRPGDSLGVASLARMYAASGNTKKAFELYKPLLERSPDNADLQLGAAEIAVQAHDNAFADQALSKALALEPGRPKTLIHAASLYRRMGETGKATDLLRQAVAIENDEKNRVVKQPVVAKAAEPVNPFVGLPGQRRQATDLASTSLIPVPADEIADGTSSSVSSSTGKKDLAYPGQHSVDGSHTRLAATHGARRTDNPDFVGDDEEPDPRAGMSDAERALNDITQKQSAWVAQGLDVRTNNSEKGLSKLTDVETPFEANAPLGDNRIALRVTPVALYAGSPSENGRTRFGSATSESVKSQSDKGVGLAVGYEMPDQGIKADLGTTPLGFLYSTVAGGVSVDRPFSEGSDLRYGVDVSRRPVTDSITSFAGSRDTRDGNKEWGGVTANGARGQLSYDNNKMGVYGYGSAHELVGNNVKDNTRLELGSGIYWYLQNNTNSRLTLGLSTSLLSYENNQDYFTYGNGGYFSPQTFFAIGVPFNWAQRIDRLTYSIKGSIGLQHIEQDAANYFPDSSDKGSRYASQSSNGVGYSLAAAGEYRVGSRFFLGAELGVDNARDYQEVNGGVYLRYTFEDMTGPMALPVSPFRSPYSTN